MKNNQRKKYRRGTLVHIPDLKVIKNNFATWLPCQVFKVSADEITSQGKRCIWLDYYSKGIYPEHVTLTTRKQRHEYYRESTRINKTKK